MVSSGGSKQAGPHKNLKKRRQTHTPTVRAPPPRGPKSFLQLPACSEAAAVLTGSSSEPACPKWHYCCPGCKHTTHVWLGGTCTHSMTSHQQDPTCMTPTLQDPHLQASYQTPSDTGSRQKSYLQLRGRAKSGDMAEHHHLHKDTQQTTHQREQLCLKRVSQLLQNPPTNTPGKRGAYSPKDVISLQAEGGRRSGSLEGERRGRRVRFTEWWERDPKVYCRERASSDFKTKICFYEVWTSAKDPKNIQAWIMEWSRNKDQEINQWNKIKLKPFDWNWLIDFREMFLKINKLTSQGDKDQSLFHKKWKWWWKNIWEKRKRIRKLVDI